MEQHVQQTSLWEPGGAPGSELLSPRSTGDRECRTRGSVPTGPDPSGGRWELIDSRVNNVWELLT